MRNATDSMSVSSFVGEEVQATAIGEKSEMNAQSMRGDRNKTSRTDLQNIQSALEAVASRPIIIQIGDVELKRINRKMRGLNNNTI